jgi:transposase
LRLDLDSAEGVSPVGRPSKFTPGFQRDAVDLVLSSGRPVNDVARELGVGNETLRNWVNKRRGQPAGAVDAVGPSPADKDAEIARLRAQVADLQQEVTGRIAAAKRRQVSASQIRGPRSSASCLRLIGSGAML